MLIETMEALERYREFVRELVEETGYYRSLHKHEIAKNLMGAIEGGVLDMDAVVDMLTSVSTKDGPIPSFVKERAA